MAKPVLQQAYQSRAIGSPAGDLQSLGPGWLIRGVVIDNPSGSYVYIPFTGQWIEPYTLGWATTLRPGALNFSAIYKATGPGGQSSTALGLPMSVTLYDSPILNSPGAAFLNADGTPITQGVQTARRQVFTANGNWVRPNGVYTVSVFLLGGGGAGGGAGSAIGGGLGGGGGAGGILIATVDVSGTPVGGNIAVVVGAGGIGDAGGLHGPNGGQSSFGALVIAGGGGGGAQDQINGSAGASGGGGEANNGNAAGGGGGTSTAGGNGGGGGTAGVGGLGTPPGTNGGNGSTAAGIGGTGGNGNNADANVPYPYGGGGSGAGNSGSPIPGYGAGRGATAANTVGGNAVTPNSGAGGGGAWATIQAPQKGGNGAAGIVVVSWSQQ